MGPRARWAQMNVPVRLMSMVRCHSASVNSAIGAGWNTPAQVTSISASAAIVRPEPDAAAFLNLNGAANTIVQWMRLRACDYIYTTSWKRADISPRGNSHSCWCRTCAPRSSRSGHHSRGREKHERTDQPQSAPLSRHRCHDDRDCSVRCDESCGSPGDAAAHHQTRGQFVIFLREADRRRRLQRGLCGSRSGRRPRRHPSARVADNIHTFVDVAPLLAARATA